ncbi:MAG TPA: tetratricopeptide repeat protein [Methylomirabilota bacterium]|nr:tetratricopeptide repeat protein [Methylomirabilota bacterium]
MKPKAPTHGTRRTSDASPSRKAVSWALVITAAVALVTAEVFFQRHPSTTGPVTFHRDVAPIIHAHCSSCHHPGQAAPFDLLTYDDVKKRARNIREVVERRIMPPWLPDPADGPFVGHRSLSTEQISVIQRWAEQGAPEGSTADAPTVPRWNDNWQLGKPDLVIRMAEPFALAADGPDVYRNFVIPIPTAVRRFVKGLELQPGNPRIVHHAFMRIDATRESQRRDEQEPGPGFGGLHTPTTAQTPQGQFLSWQPGKLHTFAPRGLAWTLETNCDLVLQTHLRPSGKPESIQSSIGFYFTDEAPTNTPFKLGLQTYAIDIPAGAIDQTIRDTYTLAADVQVLSVLPHAHYLGKELEAFATLPDGKQQRLLHISNWDFNWQGDYQFQKPVFLPRGTTLSMVWRYDNSTNNARNPHHPPQRVRYGLQSSDEMAELWLQVLPIRANDLEALARYDQPRVFRAALDYNNYLLGLNPNNARAHNEIGKVQLFLGQYAEVEPSLRKAAALDPNFDEPHYFLGVFFRMQNRLPDAATEFRAAVQSNPNNAKAHGSLGIVLFGQGKLDDAEPHLRTALRLNPQDEIARETLEELAKTRRAKPGIK